MKKIIMLIVVLITAISTNTFAVNDNDESIYLSEELYQFADTLYYEWYTDKETNIKYYLYLLKQPDQILNYSLGGADFSDYGAYSQLIYVPIDNNGDIYNLEPLRDDSQINNMFLIEMNHDYIDFKRKYETSMGFRYNTVYPNTEGIPSRLVGKKNYNFKTEGLNLTTWYPDDSPITIKPFKYQGYDGNFSYVNDLYKLTVDNIFYPADYVGRSGWSITGKDLVKNPWDRVYQIPKGRFNVEYGYEDTGILLKMSAYHEFVTYFPDIIDILVSKGAKRGDYRNDITVCASQAEYFFDYFSVISVPEKGISGIAQVAYRRNSGSIGYKTIATPAKSDKTDIKFESMILTDSEGNELPYTESDHGFLDGLLESKKTYEIPEGLETVQARYLYSFSHISGRTLNVESWNDDIVTNAYVRDEGKNELFVRELVSGSNLGKMKGYYAWDILKYFKHAEEMQVMNFKTVSDAFPDIEERIEEHLNEYIVEFNVSDLPEKGNIASNLPWQLQNYNVELTSNIQGENKLYRVDNLDIRNDLGEVDFIRKPNPEKDISIVSVEGFGKTENNKTTVIAGKTYNVKVKVKNSGTIPTENPSPSISHQFVNTPFYTTEDVRTANRKAPANPHKLEPKSADTLEYDLLIQIPSTLENGSQYNLAVAIHREEDEKDNIFVETQDLKFIEATVVKEVSEIADIGINDLWLSANGTKLNQKVEEPNYYSMLPNEYNYTLNVEVMKYNKEGSVNDIRLNVDYYDGAKEIGFTRKVLNGVGNLQNKGDKVVLQIPINSYKQFLALKVSVNNDFHLSTTPATNIKNNNDSKEKIYVTGYDFAVTEVNVSPNNVSYCDRNGTPPPSKQVVVNAIINAKSHVVASFDNVLVELFMIKPDGSKIKITEERKNLHSSYNDVTFTVPNRTYSKGNWGFEIIVNSNREFFELNYDNNRKTSVLQSKNCPPPSQNYCENGIPRTRNVWEVKHWVYEYEKNWYVCQRCVKRSKDGCTKYKPYDCCLTDDFESYKANPYPKQYTETFNLKTYMRNDKTDWNWIYANSLETNAGRGFEIKFETVYHTNRTSYPRTEHRISNGECGYDTVTPSVSSLSNIVDKLYVNVKNYKFSEGSNFVLYPSGTSGSWNNLTTTFEFPTQTDEVGDITKKFYTDLNTSNRNIVFEVWSDRLNGYPLSFGESYGNDVEKLIDCKKPTIIIKDSIDINTKTNQ